MTTQTNRVIEIKGNLLQSDCDVLLHQANCRSVMGAGFAKQLKRVYPEAYAVDCALKLTPQQRFGEYTQVYAQNGTKTVEIVNLYGQLGFGKARNFEEQQERYDALLRALVGYLFDKSTTHDLSTLKFGVPTFMGCDLAGGDWRIVHKILDEIAEQFGITIHTYTL